MYLPGLSHQPTPHFYPLRWCVDLEAGQGLLRGSSASGAAQHPGQLCESRGSEGASYQE